MSDGNEINDDEFEALLDELHGPGKAPRVDPEANVSPSIAQEQELPSALTIREVSEIGDRFQALLANQSPIQVDLSVIEMIDTAGVQLLLAFQRTAESMGLACEWKNPSDAVSKAVAQLGVETMRFSQAPHS